MIAMARPLLGAEEERLVLEVLRSGQLAAGPKVARLEAAFARCCGVPYAVMTSSGTAALQAAAAALGLRPGDKVFTTPFTFAATTNALLAVGAVPVFVDIDPLTLNLDPGALERACREHPDAVAVLVVHLYGLPAAMPEIASVARRHGLLVLEDCAQAHGAAIGERRVGSFGDAGAFSFYATKNMTTGEGGAVVTADRELAGRVRAFIDHGQRERYRHETLGYNLRMGELQAALGLAQLARLGEMNARRRENAAYYDRHIDNPHVEKPVAPPGYRHVYHQYTLRVEDREGFRRQLAQRGVSSAVHYPALVPEQPYFRRLGLPVLGGPWPVAAAAARRVVSIPVHPGLTPEERETVAAAVNAYRPRAGG